MNAMFSVVEKWMLNKANDYHGQTEDERLRCVLEDMARDSCKSGYVSEMVYYADTEEFFERHKYEINNLISDALNNYGIDYISDLFDTWDNNDWLVLEQHNKQLLARYAWETVAIEVGQKRGIEL